MAAVFNPGFDILEDIPLVYRQSAMRIEKLNCDGGRSECAFHETGGAAIFQGNQVFIRIERNPSKGLTDKR